VSGQGRPLRGGFRYHEQRDRGNHSAWLGECAICA
jgi:hypothetical protein